MNTEATTDDEMRQLTASRDRWKRRAELLRQGYQDKATEAFALNLQRLQLEAFGADKTLAMQNDSLRDGLLKACRQRNEYKRDLDILFQAVRVALLNNGGPTDSVEGPDTYVMLTMQDFERLESIVNDALGKG